MKIGKLIFLLIFSLGLLQSTLAQDIPQSIKMDSIDINLDGNGINGSTQTLNLNKGNHFSEYSSPNRLIDYVRVFLEVYVTPLPLPTVGNASVTIRLSGSNNANIFNDNSSQKVLPVFNLTNIRPKIVYYMDLTPTQFLNTNLTSIDARINSRNNSFAGNPAPSFRLKLKYEVAYRLNVNNQGVSAAMTAPTANLVSTTSRVFNFSWNTNGKYYPAYQLQILRLYNNNSSEAEPNIDATIDWKKALTVNIEKDLQNTLLNGKVTFPYTIAEGTGMYVWRVRPIGNYFTGGFANNQNYGTNWSINATGNVSTNFNSPGAGFFYFMDPDDNKNWIYSRVFTEGNNTSESISYADYLLHKRQTQSYIPSKKTTMIMQYVLDYMGRPAISTIPVPQINQIGLRSYRSGFIQNTSGQLFRAKDFDSDNALMPANLSSIKIKSVNGFEYYDNNLFKSIPNSGGFPYTRTIFENQTNSRVTEQSGPGEYHAIGTTHTVNTLYSTASSEELIRVLGDEAPNGNKVLKTTTIDQNNTASISYTDLNGKVIATCLSYNDNDIANTGDAIPDLGNKFSITETMTNNIQTNEGLISTKRISFTTATPLSISYNLPCLSPIALCGMITEANCKYQLYVVIHDVKEPNNRLQASWPVTCGTTKNFTAADFSYMVASHPKDAGQLHPSNLTFGSGDYIIEKRLVFDNTSNEILVQQAVDNVKAKMEAFVLQLIDKLKAIKTEKEFNDFVQRYQCSEIDCLDGTCDFDGATTTCSATPDYGNGIIKLSFTPVSPFSWRMGIKSECCDFDLPVEFIPPFECPDPAPDGSTFFNYPFKEYAVDFLTRKAVAQGKASDFYTGNSKVWGKFEDHETEINDMIFHMLHDSYGYNASDPEPKIQYNCADLGACWQSALTYITELDLSKISVDKNEVSADVNLDEIFDNMPGGGLIKLFGKKKIDKMRDQINADIDSAFKSSPYDGPSFIDIFLDCAVPKYAKVFVEGNGAAIYNGTGCKEDPNLLSTTTISTPVGNYSEFSLYSTNPATKDQFYRIYSFKYFPYFVPLSPNYQCEAAACFCPAIQEVTCTNPCFDDNNKKILDCPVGENNKNWDFKMRGAFGTCISKSSHRDVATLGDDGNYPYDNDESPDYPCDELSENTVDVLTDLNPLNNDKYQPEFITMDQLRADLDEIEMECTRTCEQKIELIQGLVHKMFEDNCYNIVTNDCEIIDQIKDIPIDDVTAIALQIKNQCISMCDIDFLRIVDRHCNTCTTNGEVPRVYAEVIMGSAAENKLINFATAGIPELSIESQCDGATPGTICDAMPPYVPCEKDYEVVDLLQQCSQPIFDNTDCNLVNTSTDKTSGTIKLQINIGN